MKKELSEIINLHNIQECKLAFTQKFIIKILSIRMQTDYKFKRLLLFAEEFGIFETNNLINIMYNFNMNFLWILLFLMYVGVLGINTTTEKTMVLLNVVYAPVNCPPGKIPFRGKCVEAF